MRIIKKIKGLVPTIVVGVMLFVGCETVTSGDEVSDLNHQGVEAEMARSSQWVEKVTGGGKNVNGNGVVEWISVNATNDADGNASGMFEYGNTIPNQEWRYRGSIECLAISDDGSKAVAIGPITISQDSDADEEVGSLVAFYIGDNGHGKKQDTGYAAFSSSLNCEQRLANFVSPRVTSGNYNISSR